MNWLYKLEDALLHIYYTTHDSGIMKMLYEKNLIYIAKEMKYMEELNLVGETLEEVFEVPVEMLSVLNFPSSVKNLRKRSFREHATALYQRYSDVILAVDEDDENDYKFMTAEQWEYLTELLGRDGDADYLLYYTLAEVKDEKEHEYYKSFYMRK